MRKLCWGALIVVVIWVTTPVEGATLCVNPGGVKDCFSSIRAAVDAAGSRDVIDIAAGAYFESVNVVGFARLTLQGAGAGVADDLEADPPRSACCLPITDVADDGGEAQRRRDRRRSQLGQRTQR